MTGDARFVRALVLIRSTCDVLTVWHHFVVARGTILFAVAYPASVNARDAVLAQIFRLHTRHRRFPMTVVYRRAVPFIRAVGTVEFAVAPPFRRDAVLLGTLELLDRIALRGQTFGFVRTVAAVVVSVADPPALDAASVVTGELVGAAGVVTASFFIGSVRAVF